VNTGNTSSIKFPQWSPLWSSCQSSWLHIQRSRFDSRRYQIFWEVVGLERGPLRLVSTTEELLGRKSSGSGLESRDYGRRDPLRWARGTLYPSICIFRLRTQATEFSFSSVLVCSPSPVVWDLVCGQGRLQLPLIYSLHTSQTHYCVCSSYSVTGSGFIPSPSNGATLTAVNWMCYNQYTQCAGA
jgi:hypothetical protein